MIDARELIADALGLDDIAPDAQAGSLAAWDSLGHMRIILAAEAAMGRVMTTDELASIWDVQSLAAVLAR